MKQYLAIDIGGTAVKLGIVDEEGRVLSKTEQSVCFDNYETPILTTVLSAAEQFLKEQAVEPQGLAGIGVSAASLIVAVMAPFLGAFGDFRGMKKKLLILFLALGVGFQTQLSGRENIYLSGLLLGFSKQEIDAQIQEIIDFSELGKFIEKPVRTYSSGMQSKLGFAITAILKTDIILVDEVLSVGDAHFKKKSFAKMQELISEKARTVVIVSHNSATIRSTCERVIWLHDGDIKMMGETSLVMDLYDDFMTQY